MVMGLETCLWAFVRICRDRGAECGARPGDRICRHSGRTTGAHLHYEVRIHNTPVNPHKYLRTTLADLGSDQPNKAENKFVSIEDNGADSSWPRSFWVKGNLMPEDLSDPTENKYFFSLLCTFLGISLTPWRPI